MRLDVAVAASLCGNKSGEAVPTLLSIEQGQVDRGAEVIWLSQYPSQMEVNHQPRTVKETSTLDLDRGAEVIWLS